MTPTTHVMLGNAQTLSGLDVLPTHSSIPGNALFRDAAATLSQLFAPSTSHTTTVTEPAATLSTPVDLLREKTHWVERDYREAYAEAAVEQGIAWQVRINRERRNLSQADLAQRMGTRQSAISRMEDPEYGAHSLKQLQKVARAFDCALIVKLAAYSTLAQESHYLSEDDLFVPSYPQEMQE